MQEQLRHDERKLAFAIDASDLEAARRAGEKLVVYCDGIGCNASTKGAPNLARLGFRVKERIGGLDRWRRDGYETEGAGAGSGDCE